MIISITGSSGSGKTYIARILSTSLKNCSVLSLDNYYKSSNKPPTNFDKPSSFDWRLIRDHLSKLKNNCSINSPLYSFKNHKRLKKTKVVYPSPIILVEGLYALHPKIKRYVDFGIFLDVPLALCLKRRIRRDIRERGRTKESIIHQFNSTVKPAFYKYILPTIRNADLVLTFQT